MAADAATLPVLVWVRRVAFVAFVALAAWLCVRLGLALVAPSSVWAPVNTPVAATTTNGTATPVSYTFTTNPFSAGDAPDDAPIAAVEADSDVPETTLNLIITGIRASVGDPEGGSVQIKTPDGNEKRYYVPQMIQPNVQLRGVLPDHILLTVNGQNQRLTTEDAKAAAAGQSQSTMSQPAGDRRDFSALQGITLETVTRSAILTVVNDPDPTKRGVRVSPRSPAVDLSVFNLRDGDVVRSIAGVATTSGIPNLDEIERRLSSGRPFSVDLIRDGQPMTITIGGPS